MTEFVEVQTSELLPPALDWAVLFARFGDGPDWKLSGGVFGVVGLRDVRVGMDGMDQVETFDAYNVSATAGVEVCRSIVAAKLGDTVSVPKELLV
jgi:hypothetical protein